MSNKKKHKKIYKLLHSTTTKIQFINTIIIKQLPLTITTLTNNTKTINLLFKYKTNLHNQNKKNNTIFHSLIQYTTIYPKKIITIIQILQYLNQKLKINYQINTTIYNNSNKNKYQHIHSFI